MKQALISTKGDVKVFDVPIPGKIEGSVLVRNSYSLISSGTERSAISKYGGYLGLIEKVFDSQEKVNQAWELIQKQGLKKSWNVIRNKIQDYLVPGYSSAGMVVETSGRNVPYAPGDYVACMGTGFATHSEYVVVPQNLVAGLPDRTMLDEAAFSALGCIALQGIRRLDLTPGEHICVIGLGLIGQISVQLLQAMGFSPVGFDLSSERANIARNIAGVPCWGTEDVAIKKTTDQITQGAGLDGVIICASTKSSQPVNMAFDLCRERGRVSIVGNVGLEIDRKKMYRKELDLVMSRSYGPGRYNEDYEIKGHHYPAGYIRWDENRNLQYFIRLLDSGELNLSPLISKHFPIDEAVDAYQIVKEARENIFGVLFDYGPFPEEISVPKERYVIRTDVQERKYIDSDVIRLGIIGAGDFIKSVHLPNLEKISDQFQIEGIASRSGASASAAAEIFGIKTITSNYKVFLEDESIDAVLIGTRHSSHAEIILDALDADKHVFVEKPMCITKQEGVRILDKVVESELVLRVGFNRRFAPCLVKMKKMIGFSGRRIFTCRVNIGALGDHWSNTKEEGGRFLGEAVHFFDLCNWFIGETPVVINALTAGEDSQLNPNVSCQIKYEDGSIAQILYTSLGNKNMPKELYEAFGNGASAKCLDFKSLDSFGGKISLGFREKGDKGHLNELSEFAFAVKGQNQTVNGADAKDGYLATVMALDAYRSASEKRPLKLTEE